ncbi:MULTISPECIES: adenosine kinase [Acetobacter]|uniref:Adenosine kinase n=1 Tax=Acetobacter thailandicus TaxID=1502842 RepID=A0ABT3QDP3_9PROT|nr:MULTISPECIES: adenosine kinase [Acetobacter]MBS0960197.1 adenosine kinase [Acetobacter thailandicus]MBS0979774.1 adenosine kinase [Acetobacter thailandicus]MBS0985422.1 adenosine kinase [Acetobacter thailandicus]MBS1004208.1 adenosine kinase [Acetobacter thailandicus]MCX2563412.1 adenosine kinase [Acetobacter thailandicus]
MNSEQIKYDILGIGNAITDILGTVSPAFLEQQNLIPGSMTLIDAERADNLTASFNAERTMGGGSVANSCVVAAQLGAKVAYLGKVAGDTAGVQFAKDLSENNVAFPSAPLDGRTSENLPTARCIVMVTPDGQRTMATYLGACTQFTADDVLPDVIAASRIVYLEGYLFDPPHAQEAFRRAATLAHENNRQVALSLSDPFCVSRHRKAFLELVRNHVDILFANEDEICSLYETENFDVAAQHVLKDTKFAALTRSAEGSVVIHDGTITKVSPVPTQVVDTTGAGDAYAAGFLAGLTSGRTLPECGRLASVAASEIISHVGARPLANTWLDTSI